MREQIQWIGMVSLHFNIQKIGYYIPSEFDYSSANAGWVIDGPNRYYNTVSFGEGSITSNKLKGLKLHKNHQATYEDDKKKHYFKITKMLNVE